VFQEMKLIGHLGQTPEIKYLGGSGQAVCNVTVATNEKWIAKDGQAKEVTEWHRVTCWGKLAENVAQLGAKGRLVFVTGRIKTRKFEHNGAKQERAEVHADKVLFLDSKRGEAGDDADMAYVAAGHQAVADQEIPF